MISVFACAIAINGNQQFAPPSSEDVSVLYKIKLYDRHGLISAPRIRTLPGLDAKISQSCGKRDFSIGMVPTLNSDRTIATQLELSIDGVSALHTRFNTEQGGEAYLRIRKAVTGKSTLLVASESPVRPKIGKDDLLAIISANVYPSDGSDPFFPDHPAAQVGGPAPSQFGYHVVVRDSKGVIYAPLIRTLSGQTCLVTTTGVLGELDIRLRPNDNTDGKFLNLLQFTFDHQDPVDVAWNSKSGDKSYFKLWKEDAATPRMAGVRRPSKVHLKPGEVLVEISGLRIDSGTH